MSLRSRLVFGAAAAVAVAIILASVLVYFLVARDLRGQVDASLQQNAQIVGRHGLSGPAALVSPRYKVYGLYDGEHPFGTYSQLVLGNGDVYIPSPDIPSSGKPLLALTDAVMTVARGRSKSFFYDTNVGGQDMRVYTTSTDVTVSTGFASPSTLESAAIQVAAPLTAVNNELSKIRLWLVLGGLGGVVLAAGAGLLVARSTLRPVRDLSETAERVRATRDLSQRISVAGSDELGQLATTFNEMLAALDDAAQRQQRLVQDASHELRTPLTSLRTNIEVLANGGALSPEDRGQLLHDVITQVGELTELVSELTELARGEEQSADVEDVRLDLVTADAIARTQRNHPVVSIEAELEPTSLSGTPANLERAIANLLDNAAKWSPAGAPIEVRLAGGELTVRDHGPGIAADDAPHVFERFYRATAARSMPGSGLGLAIVRRVAEAHGGTVEFEPAPGGGTLMRLRLPARPAAGEAGAAQPGPPATAETRAPSGRLAGPVAPVRAWRRGSPRQDGAGRFGLPRLKRRER
jgi:two-component system sensor histidine kinase MprB